MSRIRFEPLPGTATVQNLIRIHEQEGRLYELVEGILVEKTAGAYEPKMAMVIGHLLLGFVGPGKLGAVLGPDGVLRLAPGLVRIPGLSFISTSRLPGGT
ncbi:MAG TPA: Uma2 family endonuclease, partial [Planctomycetaceae bacterium]|nr:Uma2 family endonuclease [Planctomycetaceae bacterium]